MCRFIEALTDIKTWILFVFAAVGELEGGIGVEYGAIIKGFGFNTTQTTLLNIPSGFAVSSESFYAYDQRRTYV